MNPTSKPTPRCSSGLTVFRKRLMKPYTLSEITSLFTTRAVCHHLIVVSVLFSLIIAVEIISGALPFMKGFGDQMDPWTEYGVWLTIFLYFCKIPTILSLPMGMSSILGLTLFNTSPEPPKLMSSLFLAPFICFRVVTRGIYPNLVKQRVADNLKLCREVGLQNFQIEVVTDHAIGLQQSDVKEIVVPTDYKCKSGALFKARALNYCWEPDVSIVSDSDWVVHLDEETKVTESALIGIVNFVNDSKHDFGQGVITYGKGKIVNWITSLCDSARTGFDYGVIRFTLGYLHRPIFSWKGSFNVARASAERKVGFDFGPEGSIAEDSFFAMKAWSLGFTFDFINGEMQEESPYTVLDLIKQRKRWMHGLYLTATSSKIPFRNRFGVCLMVFAWVSIPFQVLNVYFSATYPVPLFKIIHFLFGMLAGVMTFLFLFGADKSFYRKNRWWPQRFLIDVCAVLNMPLAVILELLACLWQLCIGNYRFTFDLVQKDNKRIDSVASYA